MTDCQWGWYIGVEIAGVLATLLLAVIAIWGPAIKACLLAPKLELFLHDPEGDRIDMRAADGTTVPSRWYHLRLTNKRRFAVAHNARVVVTAISRPAADHSMELQRRSGPIQLVWQHGRLLPQYLTLGPDRICDLGRLEKDNAFRLELMLVPNNADPCVRKGEEMWVEVVGQADETETKPLLLSITWDGTWSEDTSDMKKHLVVKRVDFNQVL